MRSPKASFFPEIQSHGWGYIELGNDHSNSNSMLLWICCLELLLQYMRLQQVTPNPNLHINTSSSTATRVGYALQFLATACLSWIMMTDWAGKKLEEVSHGYLHLDCPEGTCYGVLAVYRICFASSIFVRT